MFHLQVRTVNDDVGGHHNDPYNDDGFDDNNNDNINDNIHNVDEDIGIGVHHHGIGGNRSKSVSGDHVLRNDDGIGNNEDSNVEMILLQMLKINMMNKLLLLLIH